jgi:hypothetical protein
MPRQSLRHPSTVFALSERVNYMQKLGLATKDCTLTSHIAMRLDEPNATTEADEISAA